MDQSIINKIEILKYDLCQIAIRILIISSSEALCGKKISQLKFIHRARRNSLNPNTSDPIINIPFEM